MELTYQDLREGPSPDDRIITEAVLTVSHDGQPVGQLIPTREFFVVQQQPMTIPDKRSTLADDLYVILAGWEGTGETATFKAYINPLVNWIWIGGFVFIIGTLIAAWAGSTGKPPSGGVKEQDSGSGSTGQVTLRQ